jgi:prepilin-type N-terminal cleavage/methylation domain-containing protein
MLKQQQGYTLTEIMIAVGVVAALTIGGLNFYNNAIPKAQANQAFSFGKLIVDDALDQFAMYGALPASGQNYSGAYSSLNTTEYAQYVGTVSWVAVEEMVVDTDNDGVPDALGQVGGTALVTLADTNNIHQTLKGQRIVFLVSYSPNKSFVFYDGCWTSIQAGAFDGTTLIPNGEPSPLIPECRVDTLI